MSEALAPLGALFVAFTWLDAATIAAKALGYLGALYGAGGMVFLAVFPETPAEIRRATLRRAAIWAGVGAGAGLASIPLRAAFLGGAWGMAADPALIELVAGSPLGRGVALRTMAAMVLILGAALHRARSGRLAGLGGGAALLLGVTVPGHSASLEPAPVWQGVLALHLGAVAFWLGALRPLHLICGRAEATAVAAVVAKFGRFAAYAVALTLLAGGALLTVLLGGLEPLFATGYGLLLLAKLALVAALLALAAWHKWLLAPAVGGDAKTLEILRRSIGVERVLAAGVVVATATLTSIAGPPT